jgi:hypothetical protein
MLGHDNYHASTDVSEDINAFIFVPSLMTLKKMHHALSKRL